MSLAAVLDNTCTLVYSSLCIDHMEVEHYSGVFLAQSEISSVYNRLRCQGQGEMKGPSNLACDSRH